MTDSYQNTVAALESVKAGKQALKIEYDVICEEITKAQNELDWLQTSYLPLQDLKEGIIQLLCASGQKYGMSSIRPGIKDLATNAKFGAGFPVEEYGKPMTYANIEKAINGDWGQFALCQIFTPDKSIFFDDRAFLGLLFKTIEPVVRNIMEKMSPQEFGYTKIKESEIGPGLEERRHMIADIAAKLLDLDNKKLSVSNKIRALEL